MFRVALFITTLTSATYGWRLRWADEFDGDALNTSLWQAAANWSEAPPRWNQVECYTPSNVAVHDGALWLTARLENTTCGRRDGPTYNITSGKVDSRGRGNATFPLRIEVRARLQNGWAYGLHSAAWLVGYGCDPMTSEIDVYEFEVEPSTSPACVRHVSQRAQLLGAPLRKLSLRHAVRRRLEQDRGRHLPLRTDWQQPRQLFRRIPRVLCRGQRDARALFR